MIRNRVLFPGGLLRLSVGKPRSIKLVEDFLVGQKRPNPLTHPQQQHQYYQHPNQHALPYARGLIAVVALRPGANDEAASAASAGAAGGPQQQQQSSNAVVGGGHARGERRWQVPEAAAFDVRGNRGVWNGESKGKEKGAG